ncbi:MAG: hypothetical protein JNL73_20220 [Anaerolineales bacterium]|nr:hypothetical protein [Anaerolineales bacterium]
MHTVSLEHAQLTNRLRVYKPEVNGAAVKEFDRLRNKGGVDLEQAADLLSICAATQMVLREREINHERLLEYLVNGLRLDGPGLPSPIGPIYEGARVFERLSAHIDQIAQAALEAHADQPYAASLTTWMEGERRRNQFKAWMITQPACAEN